MATNNIKPFATSSSANILKDEELATRSELLTGFPYKSKADSKLVGKLMQNATAGAYAVGQFSAKYGTIDITGSDAAGFATAFENALQAYVNEKAPSPDLSAYVTKENATLTGTATLNGQNIAVVNQIPDTSHFVTDTTLADYPTSEMVEAEFSSYDKNIKAHIESELTGYASLTGAAFSGAVTVQEPTAASNPATKGYVDSALAAKADASALANYAPLANPAFTGTATLGGKNLVTADQIPDTSGFATKDELSGYLSLTEGGNVLGGVNYQSGVAFNADVTITGTGNYTINGENIATVNQIPDTSAFITSTPSANLVTASAGITIDSEKQLAGIGAAAGAALVRLSEEKAEIFGANGIEIASPNIYIGGGNNSGYALSLKDSNGLIISQNDQTLLSIVQGTITTHSLEDESVINNLSERLILAEGSRGYLAGYESIAVNNRGTLTVNQDSTESLQVTTATAITVSDGTGNTAWVKKVSIKDAGVTISLGSAWSWAGGSQPTVTAPSLLILSWDNDCGIAILQTTGS